MEDRMNKTERTRLSTLRKDAAVFTGYIIVVLCIFIMLYLKWFSGDAKHAIPFNSPSAFFATTLIIGIAAIFVGMLLGDKTSASLRKYRDESRGPALLPVEQIDEMWTRPLRERSVEKKADQTLEITAEKARSRPLLHSEKTPRVS